MEVRKEKCHITGRTYVFNLLRTDAKGNKWWALEDPENIPAERLIIFLSRTNKLDFGLSEAFIKSSVKLIKEYARQSNIDAVDAICDSLTQRCDLKYNTRAVLDTCFPLLLLNDEDLKGYGNRNDRLKSEALDQDSQTESFFLSYAWDLSKEFSASSTQLSLQQLMERERLLETYLSNKISNIK